MYRTIAPWATENPLMMHCRFADERLSDAQKLRFIHQLMQRQIAEVRMFLDRIEACDYDVLTRRPTLGRSDLARLVWKEIWQ